MHRYSFALDLTDDIADYICYGRRVSYYVLLIDSLAGDESLQERMSMTTDNAYTNFLDEAAMYLRYFGITVDVRFGIRSFLDEFEKKLMKRSMGQYNAYLIGRARHYLCICRECELDEQQHGSFMRTASRILAFIPPDCIDGKTDFYRFLCDTLDIPDESFSILLSMHQRIDEETY